MANKKQSGEPERDANLLVEEALHDVAALVERLQEHALEMHAEARRGVPIMPVKTERMLAMSRQLREISHDTHEVLAGREMPVDTTFDASLAVEEVMDHWPRGNLSGVLTQVGALPPGSLVWGRPSFLRRALENVLTNGSRHGRGKLELRLHKGNDSVEIEVEDNGDGLTPSEVTKFFQPRAKGERGGRGLGLSSAAFCLERLGGSIEYRDAERLGGACFRITLPLASSGDRPERAGSVEQAPLHQARVVVIDDDPIVSKVLRRILQRLGAEATVLAPDKALEELVAELEEHDPDAMLIDWQLGRYSGGELYRRLQERAPGLLERVLFMSGTIYLEEDIDRPIILKPFEISALAQAVGDLLGRREGEEAAP